MNHDVTRRNFLSRTGIALAGIASTAAVGPAGLAVEPFQRTGKANLMLSLAAYSFRQFFTEGKDAEPPKKGELPKPKDWAPGATPVHTTTDSGRLHEAKAANNRDALQRAFAILDPDQQTAARKRLVPSSRP